ncbi:hypothetical protein ACJIZ3_021989 [Penstemon smallii]|uniref:Uncharacterized protein n=1 Tax=Penstemon smallii TaxID=265156 RepID=A0ABD3SNB3_9LAMI
MSWIRSAVNKAVEAGGNNNLTRTVRSYADSVVNQGIVGGSKLFQDRNNGVRNFQSYKLAVKRLEEVSVSCSGTERVQLLRRWLVSLKEIERSLKLNEAAVNTKHLLDTSDESNDSHSKPSLVLYYDPDIGGEPMNFRDVFLHSQALEGITLSLILAEPTEEELSLLLEIFRLCLMGGKEAHDVTINCVRDLSRAFSSYDEEVLAKREELLQYVQDAIAGLKVNAEIVRIDSEVSNIHKKLYEMKTHLPRNEDSMKSSEAATSMESPQSALACIRLCSRLEDLLLRKKLMKIGESTAAHNQKIDKLKILSESLARSAMKTEKRISDNRTQKVEALRFRVARTSEVGQLEKDLVAEIGALEKRKDELEVELKKVTTSLTSAHARLHNTREERDQFDVASNQIIQHLKSKDDELSKSIASYRAEAEVCNTFVNFLENTWIFQSSYAEQHDKLVNDELERHEEFFVNLATSLLEAYKEELGPSVSSIRELVANLKRLDGTSATEGKNEEVHSRRSLEEQYQTSGTNFLTTFSVVESIKKQFYTQQEKYSRKDAEKVFNLLHALDKIKQEFDSIERPSLEIETPTMRAETPSQSRTPRIPFLSPRQVVPKEKLELNNLESISRNDDAQRGGVALAFPPRIRLPSIRNRTSDKPESKQGEWLESLTVKNKKYSSDAEAQLSKLKLELELENHSRDNSMDGLSDWEFDEKFEKQPRKSL